MPLADWIVAIVQTLVVIIYCLHKQTRWGTMVWYVVLQISLTSPLGCVMYAHQSQDNPKYQ